MTREKLETQNQLAVVREEQEQMQANLEQLTKDKWDLSAVNTDLQQRLQQTVTLAHMQVWQAPADCKLFSGSKMFPKGESTYVLVLVIGAGRGKPEPAAGGGGEDDVPAGGGEEGDGQPVPQPRARAEEGGAGPHLIYWAAQLSSCLGQVNSLYVLDSQLSSCLVLANHSHVLCWSMLLM